ncbi:hypothetical protein CVT26_003978 [Gymnopilus dilepis]|uniref:Heterokaryon incompatibility domain-containing protein n=1 Tax=Gymnopilus dilepis TaxID=231916 RepID=A0A409YV05_9AGAR|nr:hypothetical protein CVT26_003978 [Gymnopilus dilepis]
MSGPVVGLDKIDGQQADSSSAAAYQYKPFVDQRRYIRLLTICPGDQKEVIQCHLHAIPLDCLPPYEALSYVWAPWGSSTKGFILCEGKPISITGSLETALRRFRLEDKPRVIWADGLCINQQDLQERQAQVLLMHDIYRQAARVLIWLGLDEKNEAQDAFDFARSLADAISKLPDDSGGEKVRMFDEEGWSQGSDAFFSSLVNPWFRRVWVLQEVGLATDARLVWGGQELGWDLWARLCEFLANCKEGPAAGIAFKMSMNSIGSVASINLLNFKGGENMRVGHVLHLARNFNCTVPHDKVYGLFGHPVFRTFCRKHGLDSYIPVYYSSSYLDTYRAVAVRLLQEPDPFYCLCLSQWSPRQLVLRPNRSWVPQWQRHEPGLLYDEFETHRSSGSTLPSFFVRGDILHANGVFVDTVEFCSETVMLSGMHFEIRRHGSRPEEDIFQDVCNVLSVGGLRRDEGRRQLAATVNEQLVDCFSYFKSLEVSLAETSRFCGEHDTDRFMRTIQLSNMRCLFLTSKGYQGLGPRVMKPHDVICVFFGGPMPFVVHPQASNGEYSFRGEAYVDGLLKGEAIKMWRAGELNEQDFKLV